MNERFKPGDLVIMQNATYFTECDGCPAVVVEGPADCWGVNLLTMQDELVWTYIVRLLVPFDYTLLADNLVCARHYQLRRPIDKRENRIDSEEPIIHEQ